MEISSNMQNINKNYASKIIKTNFTGKISKEEAGEIRAQITEQARAMLSSSLSVQNQVVEQSQSDDFQAQYEEFQSFLQNIGYEGKPIAELSQDEAAELVAEDGFFGIAQTSQRIAEFVINGAAGNEDLLRAGREGILQGFKEAEEIWGGELPEISQETMQRSLEMIDKAMADLGYSILDQEV